MKILVVEDDQPLSMVWNDALSDEGYEVTIVDTIERASSALKCERFGVIILDLMLRGQSTLALSDFALYAAPESRIILATGSNLFASGEFFADWTNIHHCVRKPVPIDDLIALVSYAAANSVGHRVASGA